MIVHPYLSPSLVRPFHGTRLLQDEPWVLNLRGREVREVDRPGRLWCVYSVYAPMPSRALGGIRVKLIDEKGFITFCNQRDLEVLIGMAKPGDYCRWAGSDYVGPADPEWFGLCADDDDLLDDLQERELVLRSNTPGGLLGWDNTPQGMVAIPVEITRRVHLESKKDIEELFVLTGDYDRATGCYPDTRLETIESRWSRAHRERLLWDRI